MARFRPGEYDQAAFFDRDGLSGSVNFADRVLRSMRAWARNWSPLETSGALLWIGPSENATIVAASPCGPGGHHERMMSYPTVEYLNRCINRVRSGRPEIFLAGIWHTHPFQDEPIPSPRDLWGVKEESQGYFGWDLENFEGTGHVEAIMARRKTRLWYVRGDRYQKWVNEVWILGELDCGIDVPFQVEEGAHA